MADRYAHGFKSARGAARAVLIRLITLNDGRTREEREAGVQPSAAVVALMQAFGEIGELKPTKPQRKSDIDQAPALGIEARSDETRSGSAEGESPTAQPERPNSVSTKAMGE